MLVNEDIAAPEPIQQNVISLAVILEHSVYAVRTSHESACLQVDLDSTAISHRKFRPHELEELIELNSLQLT